MFELSRPRDYFLCVFYKYEGPLRGGFCWFCALNSEISFNNDPNPNSFNDSQNLSDYSPQPQYETYQCELCGNDLHYGYDCPPQFPFVYEQEPWYNQNYNEIYYPHNLPSFLCCDNCEELLPQLLNDSRTIDEMLKQREQAANLEVQKEQEEQAAQSFTPYWNFSMINDDEVLQSREKIMKAIPTFLQKFSRYPFGEYLENSSNAIVPILPTEEPEYSLSMGEYEVTSDNESECDVPVCEDSSTFDVLKDHSEILSDSNNDDTSSDDGAFEDIEYVEASLVSLEEENIVYQEEKEFDLEDILQIQDVILREKLLSINRLIADIEFLNDNPTPDRVLKSSSSFPILEKSDNSLSYSDNSLPKFETFSDHMEETRNGSTTTHANNSPPEYDSFCFEIEPDQGRLTSVVMNDISDNSTNDPLLEAVDLCLVSDKSIPPCIENFDYDSEGDINFLEELLGNDSISLPENESSNFDHHDDPSFPRPPPEPSDVEFFFDFEPNSRELISVVMNNIDELNEDKFFDLGGEIDVFANIKDDDYFPFIFVIRIFLPYLTYPEVSPLLISTGSEDAIFDPGIST
nr:hypothetical protein [Tanacetum cinerariifolium]